MKTWNIRPLAELNALKRLHEIDTVDYDCRSDVGPPVPNSALSRQRKGVSAHILWFIVFRFFTVPLLTTFGLNVLHQQTIDVEQRLFFQLPPRHCWPVADDVGSKALTSVAAIF